MNPNLTSPWLETVSDERRFPVLVGVHKTDVVVVGGGIVGIITAWELTQRGAKVILLEKNHLATGDTGFTTAFITRVPDTSAAGLAKRYGQDFLNKIFRATTWAQEYLRRTIVSQAIDCDFSDCSSYNCSYQENDPVLREEWAAIKDADPLAKLVSGEEAVQSGAPIKEAIRFDREARFHVRKFLIGLVRSPAAAGIKIFEESGVKDIIVDGKVYLYTSRGQVIARKVVVTTGLPHPAFKELRPLFKPNLTFALAAKYSKGAPISDNLFWDTDEPYQYYRRLDQDTIIVGGADRESGANSENEHEVLKKFLAKRFPGDYQITNLWSGSLFDSEDGLPYAAEHPAYPGKVYVASGFGGNGMVIGTLAGTILADLATGAENAFAPFFGFARTAAKIVEPVKRKRPRGEKIIDWCRWVLPLVYLASAFLPAYVFFSQRDGLGFLDGASFKTANALLFPLVGLYAFFLVWAQVMLGANMSWLRKVFPWVEKFHRAEGIFAILFALTHPLLLLIGVGWGNFKGFNFVDPSLAFIVWLGYLQLLMMILTVTTALLMRHPWLRTRWIYIHYLNYLVFVLAWWHSWNLGSDVQPTPLKYLWYFWGLTFLASVIARFFGARIKVWFKKTEAEGVFTKVSNIGAIKEGRPVGVEVNGQTIALFKLGEKFYAIDNVCSHAGGSICDGRLTDTVIECPLHGSKFDITTGAVVAAPARTPQRTFPVQVNGQDIEIKI